MTKELLKRLEEAQEWQKDAVIDLIKKLGGYTTLQHNLVRSNINISAQAIYNWGKFGKIPIKYLSTIQEICIKNQIELDISSIWPILK